MTMWEYRMLEFLSDNILVVLRLYTYTIDTYKIDKFHFLA